MKIGKQLKIMLFGLIIIESFFLSYSLPDVMASTVLPDNSGSVSAGDIGQTDVSARIVAEDSDQADVPQSDETDAKPDGEPDAETDGTGETAKVENTVRTGDDLSAVILPICVTVISGVIIILILGVRKRHIKNPCFH